MSNKDFVSRNKRNRVFGVIVTVIILISVTIFIFGFLLQTKDPRRQKGAIAEVLESSGDILIVRSFKNIVTEPGMIVMSGDFFRTGGDGQARIKYMDDGTEVTLDHNSNLIFNAVDAGKQMNLGKGVMTVNAPDQDNDKPIVIVSHSAEVTLRDEGAFKFSFIGLDATLSVQSGKVSFRRFTDGMVINVTHGQTRTYKPAGPEKIEFEL